MSSYKMLRLFLVASVAVFAVISTTGCFSLLCAEELITEIKSPDQRRIATEVIRNCGATTDYGTVVEVRWVSSQRADSDVVFFVNGRAKVQLNWLGNETLSVGCPECTEEQVSRRVSKLGKVNIEFTNL